uniref:PAS domain-containing protein n=1 Tax=Macrostomum lignano TaxID=282301 RepID=A0A1I8IQ87_9PLAT
LEVPQSAASGAEGRHRLPHLIGAQLPAGDSEAPQAEPRGRRKLMKISEPQLLQSQFLNLMSPVIIYSIQRLSDGRRIQNAVLHCQPNVAPAANTARSVEDVYVAMPRKCVEFPRSRCPTKSLNVFPENGSMSSDIVELPVTGTGIPLEAGPVIYRPLHAELVLDGEGARVHQVVEAPPEVERSHEVVHRWSDASVRCRGDAAVRCRGDASVRCGGDASVREAGVQLDEAEPHRVEQLCRLAAVDSEAELVHKVQLRLGEHRRQLRRVSLAVEVGLVEVGLKLRHHPPAAGTSALRPPPQVDETAGVGAQLAHKRVPLVIQRVEPPLTVTSDQRLVNAVQLREVVSLEAPYAAAVRPPVACRVGQTVEVGAEQTDPGVSAVRQSAYQSVLLLTLDGRELS